MGRRWVKYMTYNLSQATLIFIRGIIKKVARMSNCLSPAALPGEWRSLLANYLPYLNNGLGCVGIAKASRLL
jgi:hypothetical protein